MAGLRLDRGVLRVTDAGIEVFYCTFARHSSSFRQGPEDLRHDDLIGGPAEPWTERQIVPRIAWRQVSVQARGSVQKTSSRLRIVVSGNLHLTREKLEEFLRRLGQSAQAPGACFITGGASALLIGWRETTIDVDLKFDPEPPGVFDVIPILKRTLSINVELAAPSDFLPPLKEWRERSHFIGRYGQLDVYHYDFVSQALSKLERGHAKDLLDVTEMLRRKLVTTEDLLAKAESIRPEIKRYPAVEEESFIRRVREFVEGVGP